MSLEFPVEALEIPPTPAVIAAVIVLGGNTFLMGKSRTTGQWGIPQAQVKWLESMDVTSKRAVLNYSGIEAEITGQLFSTQDIKTDSHIIGVITMGKVTGGEMKNETEECSEVKWVSADMLGDIQDEVDNLSADAIQKFGLYLRSRAAAAMASQPRQATTPGGVN